MPSIFFTGKTKQNLKKLKSSCALKGCRTSGQFAIHTSADFLVVFFYPKDIDPCTNVTCDYHAICKAFSAFDARCVCDDNCPSYEEPVCSSNSTTFKNKCFCLLDICRRKSNHTLYHPGSCTGKRAFSKVFLNHLNQRMQSSSVIRYGAADDLQHHSIWRPSWVPFWNHRFKHMVFSVQL